MDLRIFKGLRIEIGVRKDILKNNGKDTKRFF